MARTSATASEMPTSRISLERCTSSPCSASSFASSRRHVGLDRRVGRVGGEVVELVRVGAAVVELLRRRSPCRRRRCSGRCARRLYGRSQALFGDVASEQRSGRLDLDRAPRPPARVADRRQQRDAVHACGPASPSRSVEQRGREVDVRDLAVHGLAGAGCRGRARSAGPAATPRRAGTCRPGSRCWPCSQPLSETNTISVFSSWWVERRILTSFLTWSSTASSEPLRPS